jgi:DNA repair exonuclease SbcCD ATPase subunit
MPPKKVSKTSKSSTTEPNLDSKVFSSINNAKLMKAFEKMTKTIESATKVQKEFNTNYEALTNFKNEELNELDYQLKLKNEECYNHLQDLTKLYNEKKRDLDTEYEARKYELQQDNQKLMDELQRTYENKKFSDSRLIVEEEGYKVIQNDEFEKLQNELQHLNDDREEFEKTTTANMHKELNARLKTQELQHQVQTSDMKAKIDNQEREIESLRDTINSLKEEIQAQRELTREVAQAGQKSVTQNFGGK